MNDHINDYCNKYVTSAYSPDYALLIKGSWGCGKTHFISKYIQSLNEQIEIRKDDVVMISLFGATSINDIEMKIFEEIHPILSSPHYRIARGFIKNAIKLGLKVDLPIGDNNGGEINVNPEIGQQNRTIKLKEIEKKLLVLDDIERCDISPTVLLGYLSGLVVDNGVKVILIGNEEEYKKKFEKELHNYELIREKVIGQAFEIKPNYNEAINSFIKEYDFKNKIKNIEEITVRVVNNLKIDNLRVIKHAYQALTYILSALPSDFDDEDYKSNAIEIFIMLFAQYALNEISENDFNKAIAIYKRYNSSFLNFKASNEKEFKNYLSTISFEHIPLKEYWSAVIVDGNYSNEIFSNKLMEDYKSSGVEESNTLYYVMNKWREMTSSSFEEYYNRLNSEFANGKYLHYGDILNYANFMFLFVEYEIIPISKSEVLEIIHSVVEEYYNRIKIIENYRFLDRSYGGWGFDRSDPDFAQLFDELKVINEERFNKKMSEDFIERVMNLEDEINSIIRDIIHVDGTGKYNRVPILNLVDNSILVENLIQVSDIKQQSFVYALNERYGKRYSNGKVDEVYYDEVNVVKLILDRYKLELENTTHLFNPYSVFLKSIIKEYRELWEYIESCIKSSN